MYLPNPFARLGCDTRSIFKRSLRGLNSEGFFFISLTGFIPRLKCPAALLFIYSWRQNSWIHTFPKGISVMLNTNNRSNIGTWVSVTIFNSTATKIFPVFLNHHHHQFVPLARISLTLSLSLSLSLSLAIRQFHSFIPSSRSSRLYTMSVQSCYRLVQAGCSTPIRPCEGTHMVTSLMSSPLLLQQYIACLVHLIWLVLFIEG